MTIRLFLTSGLILSSCFTLNCMRSPRVDDLNEIIISGDYSKLYRVETKTLDFSASDLDNNAFHGIVVAVLNFINSNKMTMPVETLLLGDNKFDFNDMKFFIDLVALLKNADPLMTISLKNSSRRAMLDVVSAQGLGQQISGLLTAAIEAGSIDSKIVSVAKYIVFDDDLTFPVIMEKRVPLTCCQRFGNVMKVVVPGAVSIIVSNGLVILGLYLNGNLTGDGSCPSGSM